METLLVKLLCWTPDSLALDTVCRKYDLTFTPLLGITSKLERTLWVPKAKN